MDACTSATLRGRYARLCVGIDLQQPVKSFITIGPHKQIIEYEGTSQLCKLCGRMEPHQQNCSFYQKKILPPKEDDIQQDKGTSEVWHTVNFGQNKGKKQVKSYIPTKKNNAPGYGFKVKILGDSVGELLNTAKSFYTPLNPEVPTSMELNQLSILNVPPSAINIKFSTLPDHIEDKDSMITNIPGQPLQGDMQASARETTGE